MGLTRFNYVRSMTFQSTSKFLSDSRWVFRSLFFVTEKFEDVISQELEPQEVTGSGTDCVPSIPAQVGLITEAQLRHGFIESWEAESDPSGSKADHHGISLQATTDPISQSPSESDSDCDREVYMVGQCEQPTEKTAKEIT
jgi:hypothetical protein